MYGYLEYWVLYIHTYIVFMIQKSLQDEKIGIATLADDMAVISVGNTVKEASEKRK